MLRSLYIQNYALIEKLDIRFETGFSVITGETGAGKSIILGAIGLLLGQRADVKAIRQGASKCVIEARIEEIEKILKNAEVVVEDEVDSDKINIGCKVDVLDLEYDEEIEFQIVGSTEANSLEGKISNESPVGKALIGAHKDDIVDVETPAGIMQYKVLSIQRNI